MRRAARIDGNQNLIVRQLKQLGFEVAITSQLGSGFPDLLIAKAGVNTLVELKDGSKPPSQRQLTPLEKEFFLRWSTKGKIIVADSLDSILNQL